jgi:hypothetical protein
MAIVRLVGSDVEQIRRRLPRQFTDWQGRYLIEGDPDRRWTECRVIDISSAGAGLEVVGSNPRGACGDRIIVAIQLCGEVRSCIPGKDDRSRIGIEFVDLTEAERRYLESLAELQAVW